MAVFGCGGVGNAAVAGARLAGARTIVAVDLDDRKLAWATEFGATHTVNAANSDPVEAVRSLTDGFGADVCIEAVGNPPCGSSASSPGISPGRWSRSGCPPRR